MKRRTQVMSVSVALVMASAATASADEYRGSRFADVWAEVASDPYRTLPEETVTASDFFRGFDNELRESSERTLSDRSDLLPWFRKLVHPTGICMKGEWRITEDTPYTGYFAPGSHGLFIARGSTALGENDRGEYRAFGFAGKLFPTLDPQERVQTANFFTIEDLGGTLTEHFLDAGNTNDIIHITVRPSSVFDGPLALVVFHAFMKADRTLDPTQPLIRQLYPISAIGLAEPGDAVTPKWMLITGAADVPRVDRSDYRDELRIENYPDGLAFEIWTADEGTRLGAKNWERIGRIDIDDTVVSDSCDHRLHFPHPAYRKHQP